MLGTAAYLAPEQAAGEAVTAAADVYAVGAVLYELLTGRRPYAAATLSELFAKQRERAIAPVRELAPAVRASVENAVMRALARDPAYRPESAVALAGELGGATTAVTEVDGSAAPTKAMRRVRSSWGRSPTAARGPRWALLAAAALAAAVVVVVLAASLGGGSKAPAKPAAPPSTSGSTARHAHALATWLRDHAASG